MLIRTIDLSMRPYHLRMDKLKEKLKLKLSTTRDGNPMRTSLWSCTTRAQEIVYLERTHEHE